MRFIICVSFLLVCVISIPSTNCDKKYKLTEYTERDRRETKNRYSTPNHEESDVQKIKFKNKKHYEDNDNDQEKYTKKIFKKPDLEERTKRTKFSKIDDKEPVFQKPMRKLNVKKFQESDEDDDSEEDDVSQSCRKGNACVSSNGDDADESDDDSQEDQPVKKRITYVKKFDHEKKKKGQDKEIGNILKMHKKGGADDSGRRYRIDDDDDSSEEVVHPKRRRFVHEDDDD